MPTTTGFSETDTVERIIDQDGSHIEPPFDPSWPAIDKLRWNIAVVHADTGLNLRIRKSIGTGATLYAVTGNGFGGRYMTYNDAWTYIVNIGIGAEMMNQQNITEALEAHTEIINLEE